MKGLLSAGPGKSSTDVAKSFRPLIDNRWFSLADLLLVITSGVAWILLPKYGIWFALLALLPWGVRVLGGRRPFHRTPLDWLMAVFLLTAWIGYWAAYDRTGAWIKIWLIVTAVLLYYALSSQPERNLGYLCFAAFCCAVGLSIYFFLTHDFTDSPGGIAIWWIDHRPQLDWPTTIHGYLSGLLALTSIFGAYWPWSIRRKTFGSFTTVMKLLIALGIATIAGAFALTTSRGTWAIVISVLGIWILWKASSLAKSVAKARLRAAFPVLVLVCLAAMIVFVYLGPARAAEATAPSDYGTDSRADLLGRSAYFLADYPITGGGLGSFPGLYSQYMLDIPHFYFANSYNLFLDVAIEQGSIGGLAYILICLGSIWLVSGTILNSQSQPMRFFSWLTLFALLVSILHGLFYDYLYNGNGTLLLLLPVGMSMTGVLDASGSRDKIAGETEPSSLWKGSNAAMMIIGCALGIMAILTLNMKRIVSIWYANLGAVEMSQVELKNFPTNHWAGIEMAPGLEHAQATLRAAVGLAPNNQTANYRLGLISMLRQDFPAACQYLLLAHTGAPDHRGIIKALGYCYVWLGDFESAQLFLARVPEAKNELDALTWWWKTQGRQDLSEKASSMVSRLESSAPSYVANGSTHR